MPDRPEPSTPQPLQPIRDIYEALTSSNDDDKGTIQLITDLGHALIVSTGPEGEQLTPTGEAILAERLRHPALGYDLEHDTGHQLQLTRAAYCYAEAAAAQLADPRWSSTERDGLYGVLQNIRPAMWPWADRYWKPSPDPVRNLQKAGALAAAAGDAILVAREAAEDEALAEETDRA